MEAELDCGSLGPPTSTYASEGTTTELRQIRTGHSHETFGTSHQLATETGTEPVAQVAFRILLASAPWTKFIHT